MSGRDDRLSEHSSSFLYGLWNNFKKYAECCNEYERRSTLMRDHISGNHPILSQEALMEEEA